MGWIRHTEPQEPAHTCEPPLHRVTYTPPLLSLKSLAAAMTYTDTVPSGEWGDLWRCDGGLDNDTCRKLWRVGNACDACDTAGKTHGRCMTGGWHPLRLQWRPAHRWQRIWNWF